MSERPEKASTSADALLGQIARDGPRHHAGSRFTPSWLLYYAQEVRRRRQFMQKYGWSVPTPTAIEAASDFVGGRKLLEVGAGNALWAHLLSRYGVSVTSTDDYSWAEPDSAEPKRALPSGFPVEPGKYHTVERIGAEQAVLTFGDHEALMICWPPPGRPMAFNATSAFQGDRLVFVGELSDACADQAFRDLLMLKWQKQAVVQIPTWVSIHDAVHLYERRKETWLAPSVGRRPNPHLQSE